jgi:hypothetical protein
MRYIGAVIRSPLVHQRCDDPFAPQQRTTWIPLSYCMRTLCPQRRPASGVQYQIEASLHGRTALHSIALPSTQENFFDTLKGIYCADSGHTYSTGGSTPQEDVSAHIGRPGSGMKPAVT